MMKPTSITEAHSNSGTCKERNRWESCKQAQSSRQWKVRHNGWKLVATYPALTIFVYYHVLYPSTTTTLLLLARILVDSGFLRQLLKSNSNQYRNFLVGKNGLDGSWTHDLSNAMKLDEPFFLSRMKGKEDRASKLWYHVQSGKMLLTDGRFENFRLVISFKLICRSLMKPQNKIICWTIANNSTREFWSYWRRC